MDACPCKRLCQWVGKVDTMESRLIGLSTWTEPPQAYARLLDTPSNDAASIWSRKLNS